MFLLLWRHLQERQSLQNQTKQELDFSGQSQSAGPIQDPWKRNNVKHPASMQYQFIWFLAPQSNADVTLLLWLGWLVSIG